MMECGAATGGLSPRVRGNPERAGRLRGRTGSIPACAGEPPGWGAGSGRSSVYPRVCGGTSICLRYASAFAGLSPRVRGNLRALRTDSSDTRSIPACAGEPSSACARAAFRSVYPRVCGGTTPPAGGLSAPRGLSPRVRGNPRHECGRARHYRSIPACAGEPRGIYPMLPTPEVYPRVCGGTHHPQLGEASNEGLSPRVRGNHRQRPAAGKTGRSIPACAGEP